MSKLLSNEWENPLSRCHLLSSDAGEHQLPRTLKITEAFKQDLLKHHFHAVTPSDQYFECHAAATLECDKIPSGFKYHQNLWSSKNFIAL